MAHYTITVARGFGSGGRQVAAKLADALGVHSYEHRILALASQYSGIDAEAFEAVDEKLPEESVGEKLRKLTKRLSPYPELRKFASDDYLFRIESDIIRKLHSEESCIIVGKAADYVLKDQFHVLSVYIDAPREFCRERIMKRMQVPAEKADELIEKTDTYRADYYRYYTGGEDWTNMHNYDLVLNTQRLGLDGCVEIIRHALFTKFPDLAEEAEKPDHT